MLNITGSSQYPAEPLAGALAGPGDRVAVYGFNVLGDALRDVLDPRLRGSR